MRREQLGLGREQLGLGRQQLERRMQLRLWLRKRRLWLQLQWRVQLRVRMQLQLRMQRFLLLSPPRNGTLRRPAFAARQRDRQSSTTAATSRWMSSGVLGSPPAAQRTTAQPWARAISPAHSRQRRR